MLGQHLDDGGRRGDDVRADLRAVEHMDGVAQRGSQNFRLEAVIVVDEANILDQLEAVEAIVVMPADEGRDEGRARLGRQQRLVGGEAKGDIDLGPLTGCLLYTSDAADE